MEQDELQMQLMNGNKKYFFKNIHHYNNIILILIQTKNHLFK